MYQISFVAYNVGLLTVKFNVSFGIQTLYKGLEQSSNKESFFNLSQKISIVSVEIHNDPFNIGWNRLDIKKLRVSILSKVLEIKTTADGNYFQDADYNWIP
jgi:hypothetical protein